MSHADELSMEAEGITRKVKQEVATPRPIDDMAESTADEGPSRRLKVSPSPRHTAKRKRNESVVIRAPSGPATHVLWTRAFPKISASALEAVSGHRNASTFAAPVKERDAPGYKSLILRPQDLKSIRSAITAGNRAAAAAAPEDQSQSSVWLPISEDLIPPKGIINYAQLEKELMRMFANAIMFNADPLRGFGPAFENKNKEEGKGKEGYEIDEDSLVKDTRAMFEDVQKVVGELRHAERRSEEALEREAAVSGAGGRFGPGHNTGNQQDEKDEDADELAGEAEGLGMGSIAKRRRKA